MSESTAPATVQDVRNLALIIKTQADTIDLLIARLTRVERLADGLKNAVCFSSEFVPKEVPRNEDSIHGKVCEIIALAQQPAPSAEGTPVAIDADASAAAQTNADATEKADPKPIGRCENCGTPYYTPEGFCGTCSPSKL